KHYAEIWDIQWVYSIWKQNGLAVLPAQNLVRNLGFGSGAINTVLADHHLANLPLYSISGKFELPQFMIPEPEIEALISRAAFIPQLSKRIYYRLRLLQANFQSK
ncbi:MAG: hypothetical protein NZ108_03795, partial [Bacteroidia bacterium]|nr:hypothetical protein [Bacteroidia bacterium]